MAGRYVRDREIIVRCSNELTKAQIYLKIIRLLIDEREKGACSNDFSRQGKI
jgi:hypothetical protein